jgi:hypothetical protein
MNNLGPIITALFVAIVILWILTIEGCTPKVHLHKYEKKKMRYGI